ncbi:MAG: bacteriocin fulvocin C-related protein, partial [Gemmatimonadales bacterium]|nr:bacteriocin fulvocin C-related protein [Gemmatimonadales bacterium]
NLQEFSRIPLFANRAAVRAMTLENKSRIWKERLNSLSRDERFSTAQREVLVRFAESLVPQAYVPGSAENAKAKTLCEAAKDWPEELKAELRQLVATSSLQKTVASVSEGLGRQIASLFQLNADFPYCNCDRDSWCSGGCQIALCRGTDWGCGCGFIWACDGCDSGCGW